jgi:hypothetical protein
MKKVVSEDAVAAPVFGVLCGGLVIALVRRRRSA